MTKRSVSARVKDCAILEPYVQTDESPLEFNPQCKIRIREHSDLMVECLNGYGLESHLRHCCGLCP